MKLYLCENGHLSSSVESMAGCGDGPPFECHYPCMAPIVDEADMGAVIDRMREFGTKRDQQIVRVLRRAKA